jgi:cytoskeletal protein CcmA (bactofilin family)
MPRNNSGIYSLPQAPFTPGTVISSAAVNSDFADIATALTGSVAANGTTPITAPLLFFAGSSTIPGLGFVGDSTTGFGQVSSGHASVYIEGAVIADVTAAGIAIAGAVSATGNVTAGGNLIITGTITGTGLVTLNGGAAITGGLTVDTLTATTATITNLTAANIAAPFPQGYLTPVSNTPIITGDSIAATTVFYTPFQGVWAFIHNGTNIIPYKFSQMVLNLTTSQAASGIYDIFLAYNSNVPVIGSGPSWAAGTSGSVAPGACARGTGVGGAAINRDATTGLWVNTAAIQLIYNVGSGNNTITVPVGQAIYLGSIYIDATAGQITCHRSYGQSRKWAIWNPYNKTPTVLQAGDPTASWTLTNNAGRASNGASANTAMGFTGLSEEFIDAQFVQNVTSTTGFASLTASIGIGLNSITTFSGQQGVFGSGSGVFVERSAVANLIVLPGLGINAINMMESAGNTTTYTFNGTSVSMLLLAKWRA